MGTVENKEVGATSQLSRLKGRWHVGKAVGVFVPDLTKKAFQKFGFSAATLLTNWTEVVGKDWAGFTRPERLKWPRRTDAELGDDGAAAGRGGATLVLRVEPARALDVQYQSKQILERINAYFGYGAIAEIRILQAPIGMPEKPQQSLRRSPKVAGSLTGRSQPRDRLTAALAKLEASVRAEIKG